MNLFTLFPLGPKKKDKKQNKKQKISKSSAAVFGTLRFKTIDLDHCKTGNQTINLFVKFVF